MTRLFPPDHRDRTLARIKTAITAGKHLTKRRHRSCPRVIKRGRHNSYPIKKPAHHPTRHHGPPTTTITTPTPQAPQPKLNGIGS